MPGSRELLQFPVRLIRGRNLDFSLCTIPTECRFEKYGVFGNHVGIVQREKLDFSLESIELETVILLCLDEVVPDLRGVSDVRLVSTVWYVE